MGQKMKWQNGFFLRNENENDQEQLRQPIALSMEDEEGEEGQTIAVALEKSGQLEHCNAL